MSDPIDPNKSCLNCPSLLPATDSSFFKKSLGVQVCARFGKPIGRITSKQPEIDAIAKTFASRCEDYGKPKPATPDWSKASFQVTTPDPDTLGVPRSQPHMVSSCAGCKFFVREDVVADQLGWTTAACSAKGKLLLANRYTLEARACTEKDLGSARDNVSGMFYLPEYEDNFFGDADPTKAFMKAKENFVDPTEYETDREVAPEDAHKIRAWRKVVDPATGNHCWLPIYRRDFFDEELQHLIPSTGDDEHPEDYVDHNFYVYKVGVLWTELDETPAFWGQAGTGKTEFYRHMAYLMQVPFHRFSITASSELDDLAGKMHYTEGIGTHFEKGRIVKAWESPCVMVVDEPNAGPPEVWQFIRPMTDNSKQLILDMWDGRPSVRDDDCYMGMAMNPAWDILNSGVAPIADADANRLMHLYIELPPEKLEREIIQTRCAHDGWEIPESTLSFVMKVATDIRDIAKDGTLSITWAIRPQIKVARALRWFDALTAYKMASGDFLEPAQQEHLLNIVRTHMEDAVF